MGIDRIRRVARSSISAWLRSTTAHQELASPSMVCPTSGTTAPPGNRSTPDLARQGAQTRSIPCAANDAIRRGFGRPSSGKHGPRLTASVKKLRHRCRKSQQGFKFQASLGDDVEHVQITGKKVCTDCMCIFRCRIRIQSCEVSGLFGFTSIYAWKFQVGTHPVHLEVSFLFVSILCARRLFVLCELSNATPAFGNEIGILFETFLFL